MSLFVEYHLIQNFAPSNLNRDDTGAPKDALFGGHRRARVSSQCFKRAVRLKASESGAIKEADRGVRTKKLLKLTLDKLEAQPYGRARAEAEPRVVAALAAAGLKLDEKGQTEYLLFLGQREIDGFVELVHAHWDELTTPPPAADDKKKSKKEARADAPEAVKKKAKGLLDGGKAIDVALFGRMLADMPGANQDAACQVAHALSTHRVEREFDYFTAVDDKGDDDETGAGMIGQVEFNSATFYRYAVLDAAKLVSNLQGDRDLALTGIAAFTEALARAIPTGKQNTFAAHNPPSFIGVVLRHGSPFNLANAFEKPVWPDRAKSLTSQSVEALAGHEQQVAACYGDGRDTWAVLDLSGAWPESLGKRVRNLAELGDWIGSQVAAALDAPRS
ncbi:type I-E CRISPR-associated protein Cas7/Cse4/CasC [Azohydromonas australica]|uniref:type I-E CRISPR-associated protein Cas7/Cse4/CasC n=1 Tax=Azohydromonas australica TaxID=364039 RepID=UPI00040CA869|nr:type I-E CRISPR-associated protein Cas7/Cse4/CasC [Azohydromonas australica]